jgi:hypothetical protein
MPQLSPTEIDASIFIASLLAYAFVWVASMRLSTLPKVLARIAPLALVIVPIVLSQAVVEKASAPKPEGATSPVAEKDESRPRDGEARVAEEKLPPEQPRVASRAQKTPVPATAPKANGEAVGAPRSSAGAGEGPALTDWDVVPVFYGTDRGRADNPKRVAYGSKRARKLELGRALVTIPKLHQVPNIERPWAIRIPYFQITVYEQPEDPKLHFTIRDIQVLSRDQFIALARERMATGRSFKDQAIIFVHGYNNDFDYALFRTAQIAYDLQFDGAPFLYSWPSGGAFTSYVYDRDSSMQAEPYLREFIELVVTETGAKSVSLIAHSMGNLPLL